MRSLFLWNGKLVRARVGRTPGGVQSDGVRGKPVAAGTWLEFVAAARICRETYQRLRLVHAEGRPAPIAGETRGPGRLPTRGDAGFALCFTVSSFKQAFALVGLPEGGATFSRKKAAWPWASVGVARAKRFVRRKNVSVV